MVKIVFSGGDALKRWARDFERAASDARRTMAAALNGAGGELRRRTAKAEAEATGLPTRTLSRAQKAEAATADHLVYSIRSEGGRISLKYFRPMEASGGVEAKPWGVETLYQGAFLKAGRWPDRVDAPRLHGNVFRRTGRSRLPIEKVTSDVVIPIEMCRGPTLQTFERGARQVGDIVLASVSRLVP